MRRRRLVPNLLAGMRKERDPIAALERWRDHGADWRVVTLRDDHAVIELLTCIGDPVERFESDDPDLIRWVRAELGAK
ncbi:MAG: hypothetical protein NVSMB25_02760 [Thermoleophilaceae bacterium]